MAVRIVSRETKKIRRRNTEHGQLTLINLWILHIPFQINQTYVPNIKL